MGSQQSDTPGGGLHPARMPTGDGRRKGVGGANPARLAILIASVAAAGTSAMAADVAPMSESLRKEGIRWPGEGGKRLKVSLGVYLIDFARINLREESFDMAGYLDVSWTDPGLALKEGERRGQPRRFRPGQVWTPALEFVNAVEQVLAEREGDVYVDDQGHATQRVRFSHKFQSQLDLRRFPFDRQTLTVVVAPFDPFAKDLDLQVDGERVGKLSDASVTDWEVGQVAARVEQSPREDRGNERLLFEVNIARRSTFYVWRVLLPMTLLVISTWLVFWFDVTNLQPQVSTGLAILLSLVTFTYAVDFSLPKVAYLTFIDRYTLTAFSFVLAVIFAVSAIHVILKRRGPEAAQRIQDRARYAFPLAFLAAIVLVAALSLR
ncbi:Proton-gated ion channel precursor [Aquisphaera giovannonii]|uniref:Proton-gated ion channel n=1 Tax=Aquisphaera giovannonii TaxID=406548 RepID=A0A5B9VW14_9BACT|nr:hypothetical protein [Aquisphaera giovannonii]QEH31910.1 Proton-gated ion channel precursor [Aquisphaera giovannonii]